MKYLISLVLALSLFGCGSMTRELEQVEPEVAALEISVKSILIASESVDSAAILVELVDKKIVLSGFVDSEAESTEAARLATTAAEGAVVDNQLEVR